jgi:GT2 family glycosyltransferase
MEVATIIVNYRTAGATIGAVTAAFGEIENLADSIIVVVDNDSGDGSFEQLKTAFAHDRWHGRVLVISSGHNGGFGYGVNVGVKHVIASRGQPRYFLVLNPDTTIDPGALGRLMAFMSAHPDAGLLGNVIRNAAGDKLRGFRFPSLLGELEASAAFGLLSRLLAGHKQVMNIVDSSEVDWVSGVSMLFRSEVFSTAGLFDERFFLYFEEIDLAFRIRESGWKIYFVSDAAVDHVGGLSTGLGDKNRRMPKYWFESRRRYLVKHHGRLYAAACDAAWICGHAIFKAKSNLLRREAGAPPKVGRDFIRYSLSNLLRPAPEAEQYRSRPAELAAQGAG